MASLEERYAVYLQRHSERAHQRGYYRPPRTLEQYERDLTLIRMVNENQKTGAHQAYFDQKRQERQEREATEQERQRLIRERARCEQHNEDG